MIETYKYVHGVYEVDPPPFSLDTASMTRGHCYKLVKRRSSKNTRLHFFTNRVVNAWNSLPANIVEAPTINCFKNRLDKHWADKHYNTPKLN